MNAGDVVAIAVIACGVILIKIYVNRRMKREVKVIDNISYPDYDTRNRSTASTTNNISSGTTKDSRVKNKIETGRRIPIPINSSGARGESIKRKDSNSIKLHKPTAL